MVKNPPKRKEFHVVDDRRRGDVERPRQPIRYRVVLDVTSIGGDHRDSAIDEGSGANASLGIKRQRIKPLVSADPGDEMAAMRRGPGLLAHDPRLHDVKCPQSPRLGLRDVEDFFVGGQADPVGVTIGKATSAMKEPSAFA